MIQSSHVRNIWQGILEGLKGKCLVTFSETPGLEESPWILSGR